MRRSFRIVLVSILTGGVLVGPAAPAPAQTKAVTVTIGWNPLAGSGPITALMVADRLFEKHAAKYGYDVTVNLREFVSGPAFNEAVAAGKIDIDLDAASLAIVSRMKAKVAAIPVGVHASHITNAILVPPGSPIKDVADLQGKTVGLIVGSASHYLLGSLLYYHLGKSIPEANVRIVSMHPSEGIKMPRGLDAAGVWVPQRFMGPAEGLSELLVDGDGYTGKAHRTPGVRTEEVKKSWAYPEGYNTDRLYIFARERFVDEHPDLIVAFLLARWEAQEKVAADHARAKQLVAKWWKMPEQVAETTLQTYAETAGIRDVPLTLEWDVLTLRKSSEFLASLNLIDAPLTWDELKAFYRKGATLERRAWEERGARPDVATMERGFRGRTELYGEIVVNGGRPVWMWASDPDWVRRFYKPGPFLK